jgi:hypothetical protein
MLVSSDIDPWPEVGIPLAVFFAVTAHLRPTLKGSSAGVRCVRTWLPAGVAATAVSRNDTIHV